MIRFQCDHCGYGIKAKDAMASQAGTCPKCRRVVQIPPQSTVAEVVSTAGANLAAASISDDDYSFGNSRAGRIFKLLCLALVLPLTLLLFLMGGTVGGVVYYIQYDQINKREAEIEQLEERLADLKEHRFGR